MQRVKEKMNLQALRARLRLPENPGIDRATLTRTMLILAALAGMLFPWVKLDGYREAMTGAELVAYALTSPERVSIFGVSKLGTTAVLLVPTLSLAAAAYGFFRIIQEGRALGAHLTGAVLPVLMVLLYGPIASSDGPALGTVTIPGAGVFVTMTAQAALFVEAMVSGKD